MPTDIIATEYMLCILDQDARPHCATNGMGDRFDQIHGAPPLHGVVVTSVPGVGGSMCGLAQSDGAVWCWRLDGPRGQTATRLHPGPYVSLAGGWDGTCARAASGEASCWGANDRGQLGDGTTTPSSDPVAVAGGHRFVSLASGYKLVCGAEEAGAVWCWGGQSGQPALVPERIDVPWVRGPDIRVGYESDVYVVRDGRVRVLWRGAENILSDWFAPYPVADFSLDWSACIRTPHSEVFCSWDLVYRGISESYFPQAPIPVPPPPNGW
jgi:hypothetical protein